MSIIEKAMGKRSEARSQPHGDDRTPRLIEHPAVSKRSSNETKVTPLCSSTRPQTYEKYTRPTQIARLKEDRFIELQDEPNIADEYRRIKRPLLANAFGKGVLKVERGNLIMLTSAVPGEGKSFTSVNLAHSITLERNTTVLLIDADMATGETSRLYDLKSCLGLADVLLDDELYAGEVLVGTDSPSLSVLPAGQQHTYAAELLASRKMEALVDDLTYEYPDRVIIFDAPPLLATSDALVLASLVGQIVVVVEAGRTPQHMVKDAIAALDSSKAINFILNKTQKSHAGRYYGGNYGYGRYGYGSE